MKKTISAILFVVAFVTSSCSESSGHNYGEEGAKPVYFKNISNGVVLQWNVTAQQTMRDVGYDPMIASRVLAMVHLAMHDALNNIAPVYETYRLKQEDKKADPVAALSAAAHTVLVLTFPDQKEQLDNALAQATAAIKSEDAKKRGLALGLAAGTAIFNDRKDDGAFANPVADITNPQEPGLYQGVPPTPFVYAPFWATLKPFGLETPQQFRATPMPALTSQVYVDDFNEVKLKGALTGHTRSEEETAIAKFWYEFSEIGWNRVTYTMAESRKLDLVETTRLFALVNMALADSYIAGWDSKFFHNFWRPYTAIRAAATDGNDATVADEAWEPLMATPPVHDYPSTHSMLGNAAAVVLTEYFGDNVGFSFKSTSADPVDVARAFQSFFQAARENADSRVYAGLHFRFSCDKGLELGAEIGKWTLDHHLKPRSKNGKSL